jgi:hypothetical protein
MPQVRWQARSDGLYWIDVALGTRSFSLMIDLGLVDLNGRVGFSVEPAIYAQLKKAGQLKDFLQQSNRDASGKIFSSESGRLAAQLIDPITFLPVGRRSAPCNERCDWRSQSSGRRFLSSFEEVSGELGFG